MSPRRMGPAGDADSNHKEEVESMTKVQDQKTNERAEYATGLRLLADLLEQHPEVPLPYTGGLSPLLWILTFADDQRGTLATIARLLPGKVDKEPCDNGQYLLSGRLAGLRVEVVADLNEVCERVVTGTREVVEEVPDAVALAAVPTTKVTKTVEDVEWVCRPLLASERYETAV